MDNAWRTTKLNRLISLLLVFTMLITQCPVSAFAWEGDEYAGDDYADGFSYDPAYEYTDMDLFPGETDDPYEDAGADDAQYGDDWDEYDPYELDYTEEENVGKLYEAEVFRYGYIQIWNFEQLLHVGSGLPVTSLDQEEAYFGQGETIWIDEDTPLTYAPDADYMLACNIMFPDGCFWTLPEDFTGYFVSWKALSDPCWSIEQDCPLLLNEDYDTLYLYNAAQLDAVQNEHEIGRDICAQDYDIFTFGAGEPICPEGEEYAASNSRPLHYVLSKLFSYRPGEEELRAFYRTEQADLDDPEQLEDYSDLKDWDETGEYADVFDEDAEDYEPNTEESALPLSADPETEGNESTEDTDSEAEEDGTQESAENTDSEAEEDGAPESTENTDSEAEEDGTPENAENTDSEEKEDGAPESAENTDSEEKEDGAPESTENTDSEAEKGSAPESADNTNPETGEKADAEAADPEAKEDSLPNPEKSTDSEKKEDTSQEPGEKADPEKKEKTAQEPAEKTDSNKEEKSAQTVKTVPTASLRQDESAMTPAAKAYQYGYIYIYHFAQLQAVGSEKAITTLDHEAETFGLGGEVWADENTRAVYAKDGSYVLANDIPFPDGETWVLPEGFTGKFIPLDQANAAVAEAAERERAERAKTAAAVKYSVEYSAQPEYAQVISDEQQAYGDSEEAADISQAFDQADDVTADAASDAGTDAAETDAEPDGVISELEAYDTASFDAPFAEPEGDFSGNEADDGLAENEAGDMELSAGFETDENIETREEPGDYGYENEAGEDQGSELNNTGEAADNGDVSDLPEEESADFDAELLPAAEESVGEEEKAAAQETEPEEPFRQAAEGDPEEDEETDASAVPSDDGTESRDAQNAEDEKTPLLYDADADTVYLYHPYQLTALQGDDRGEQPVMSLDYDAARFGTGKLIPVSTDDPAEDENTADTEAAEGEDKIGEEPDTEAGKPYLTYSGAHHYVLSAGFSAEQPEPAEKLRETESYRSGYIFIHHFDQLFEIASGHVITAEDHLEGEIGRGDAVWADQNTLAFYAPDANYVLMSDIPFPDGKTWVLSDNFSGRFVLRAEAEKQLSASGAAAVKTGEEPAGETEEGLFGDAALQAGDEQTFSAPGAMEEFPEEGTENAPEASPEESPLILSDDAFFEAPEGETKDTESGEEASAPTLYNKDTDTLYLYHPYQLLVLRTEDREKQPVMSMDYDMASFGMGKFIFPDGEEEPYLCYGEGHRYVLSEKFSTALPKKSLKAPRRSALVPGNHIDGRDFFGQTSVEIGGTTDLYPHRRPPAARRDQLG